MKLIRFGDPGQETPGLILQDGTRIDASAAGSDYSEEFFANDGLKQLYSWLQKNSASAPRVRKPLLYPLSYTRGVCLQL